MATKRVSREELYEQVWKTPMSRLAAEYGVSDVALAKTCRRMNVPKPGRGHWARLAAGERVRPVPLPQPRAGDELWTHVREPRPASPYPAAPRVPRVPPPKIAVPRTLRTAHDAIIGLGARLTAAKRDEHERIIVPGKPADVLVVSVESHRRALLLLDGLAKCFQERGHAMVLLRDGDHVTLQATVHGIPLAISISEHLDRTEHVPTAAEQDRIARGVAFGIPKYDYDTGGRLQITLHGTSRRAAWSDTDTKRLEGLLGAVVVAAESEIEHRRLLRLAEEERQRQEEQRRLEREEEERRQQSLAEQRRREREEEERRRKELEEEAKHEARRVRAFEGIVGRWRLASDARAFLAAFKEQLPAPQCDMHVASWLLWAEAQVAQWDPLSEPIGVASEIASGQAPGSDAKGV